MPAKIVKVYTENLPALRLIGKQIPGPGGENFIEKWDEWLSNGWFDQLEKLGPVPENGYMYLGVTDSNGGYWIGLFFQPGTPVPDGFEYAEIPAAKFAILQFDGKKDKELLSEDGINLVIEEIHKRNLTPAPLWNGWCIERYSRPAPDGKGKILIDCLYEIQS